MTKSIKRLETILVFVLIVAPLHGAHPEWRSMAEVLAGSAATDWRDIEPHNLLFLELDRGTVVMQLAPQFAPRHIANLRELVAAGHFREASVKRSQDNYVVQWSGSGPLGDARQQLLPEFYRDAENLAFTRLDSRDAYAPEVGFSNGFPVGRDSADGRAWLAHCYGMLGAGRAAAADSGNAAELYVVTGHSPRHLDRNVTLLGRVIDGLEILSSLPRGSGPLGFYTDPVEYLPIRSLRFGTDGDLGWQALRTDTATFTALVESRRYRNEDWFVDPAGAVGLCNVPLPVRHID